MLFNIIRVCIIIYMCASNAMIILYSILMHIAIVFRKGGYINEAEIHNYHCGYRDEYNYG